MPRIVFEPTNPVFERENAVRPLDRLATVMALCCIVYRSVHYQTSHKLMTSITEKLRNMSIKTTETVVDRHAYGQN
jgi:hypothetical protein